MKSLSLFLGLALIAGLVSVGCSSGPTSPSTGSGATIQGFVNPSTSIQSVRGQTGSAARAGITVTVMGTGISTVTDSQGRFTLVGVQGGTAALQFTGDGVNATLTISGLVAGQTLTVTVRLSGSDAELEPGEQESPEPPESPKPPESPEPSPSPTCFAAGDHAEVEGDITQVAASSITVHQGGENGDALHRRRAQNSGDFLCNVTATTRIRKGDTTLMLSDLKVGNHVHVSGTGAGLVGGICTVNADEIKLQGGGD